ncbi:hypothetical protein OCB09_26375 [Bacillus cereus]|nr:hypothetical protein [Bacillus cereus]MCU5506847.1 hypothetical protein [Bacillus cereus]MCU5702396.1 hypothetical protein [Bacillus cereus]
MTIIKLSCIFVIVIFLVWLFIRLLYCFLEKKAQQIEERQESKKAQLRELRKDTFENGDHEVYYNDLTPFKSKQRKKSAKSSTYIGDNSTYVSSVLTISTFHSHYDNSSGDCRNDSSSDAGGSSCD